MYSSVHSVSAINKSPKLNFRACLLERVFRNDKRFGANNQEKNKLSLFGMFQKLLYTLCCWKNGRMEGWEPHLPSFHPSIRAGFLLSSVKSFSGKFETCPKGFGNPLGLVNSDGKLQA